MVSSECKVQCSRLLSLFWVVRVIGAKGSVLHKLIRVGIISWFIEKNSDDVRVNRHMRKNMAKFLKSIFQPSDTRRTISYEGSGSSEEDRGDHPPMDGRRKLSISRSGRMKQAQKKRLSLTLDIYGGEDDLQQHERPKSIEYHVNPVTPTRDASPPTTKQRRRSGESRSSADSAKIILRGQGNQITVVAIPRQVSADMRSPDEEIDNAFGVIDKL